MGRHSSGGGMPYVLSFALWAIPYVVIACLVGFGIWAAVNTVGGDDVTVQAPSPSRSPSPTPSPTRREPTPEAEATPEEAPSPEPSPRDDGKNGGAKGDGNGLHPGGVTVQVINGTGGIQGAAEAMADRLARLGYSVEAFTTGLTVDQSVVLYSSAENSEEAVALAGYLGFVAGPAPSDLTPTIDLHVIVSAADV